MRSHLLKPLDHHQWRNAKPRFIPECHPDRGEAEPIVPHLQAALLIFLDRPHPTKQEAVAIALAATHELTVIARCVSVDAALALVLARTVTAVVAALPPRDDGALEKAGAELFIARPDPAPARRTVDRLIRRLADLGLDSRQIARALELDSSEVRRKLRFRARKSPE